MNLGDYYNKERHTRKENIKYNKIMRAKYEKYLAVYHKGKIKYRTRAVSKYTFKEFKEAYEFAYKRSEGKNTLKNMTKLEKFSTLSEYSYNIKKQNLIANQERIKSKKAIGLILTPEEELVLSVDPNGNIHKIVAYFDKLGLNHLAFDSPGSAEN